MKNIFNLLVSFVFVHSGDIFLLDRGFRDVQAYLTDKGYIVKMPDFIEKNQTGQLSSIQANSSRLVTACRFPVETRNGHMKTIWHLFDQKLLTFDLPHIMSDYRIGASLINRFHDIMESNASDSETIARNMLTKLNRQNEFAVIVDSNRFNNSIKIFTEAEDSDIEDFVFPNLAKDELRLISLGNYQPNVAVSYIYEHIKHLGKFEFFIFPTDRVTAMFNSLVEKYHITLPAVVLVVFKSRFRNKTKHRVYILVDQSIHGRERIIFFIL